MQIPDFRKKPLLVALAAAQLMLAYPALAVEDDYVSGSQTSTVTVYADHAYFNVMADASITVAGENGLVVGGKVQELYNYAPIHAELSDNGITRVSAVALNNTLGYFYNGNVISTGPGAELTGIINTGEVSQLVNNGQVLAGIGVDNLATINNFFNNGTIAATNYGIRIRGDISNGEATIGQLTNYGLISGETAAIYNTGVLSTITNGGTIQGDIINESSNDMTINGGQIIYGRSIVSLNMIPNGMGTLTGNNGEMGQIINKDSNLIFGSGRLLLNDNIYLDDRTAVNQAATLHVDNTVKIDGNYWQKSDATLEIGVSDPTQANGSLEDAGYGRLRISGSALIESGSTVALTSTGASYGFANGQRYLVVSASGNATSYNASALNYRAEGFNGSVYGKQIDGSTHDLVLYLTTADVISNPGHGSSSSPDNGFATTANAVSSLKGLAGYRGVSSPALLNLYNASMAINSRAEANKAGEQLAPAQNSASSSAASAASLDALAVVNNHVNSTRIAQNGSPQRGVATGDDPLDWAFWGQPFYGNARQGMVDDVSGYSAHYGGLVLGADRQVAENWRAGGALTYSHASVRGADNLTGNHTDVDAWGGIAYASWTGSPVYLNLSASLTSQQYDSQRQIAFSGYSGQAGGRFNGQQVVTKAEAGYPIFFGEGTTLTPLAGMSYSYLHQDDYKEHSDDGAGLAVDASHTQSVRSSLGGKLEHSWSTAIGDVVPFVQAMWTHEYDRSRTANSASFVADSLGETRFTSFGATPVADTADLSTGVTIVQADDLSLSARYDLSTAPHFDAQTVSLRLRKLF